MRDGMTLARCIMAIARRREEPATVPQEAGTDVMRGAVPHAMPQGRHLRKQPTP